MACVPGWSGSSAWLCHRASRLLGKAAPLGLVFTSDQAAFEVQLCFLWRIIAFKKDFLSFESNDKRCL